MQSLNILNRIPGRLQAALVLLPALVAYLVMYREVVIWPMIDDFWHILAFAIAYKNMPDASGKIHLLLTSQVGPYKLIAEHAFLALQLSILGHLSFPLMILVGNLTLLALLAIFWKNTAPRINFSNALLVLPVSLFLFTLNYAETIDWSISGLQQPGVILLSIASIHFLTRPDHTNRDLALACTCALLACLTYANGLLVFPAGLLYLWTQKRCASRLTLWSLTFAACAAIYLYHYQFGQGEHISIQRKVLFLVMFCGGGFENMHHRPLPYVSIAIGLAILAVLFDAVRTRFDLRNPFFFYTTLWVMITAIVVANERVGMGLALSLSSRYKIYCDLLLVFCYVYLLDRSTRKNSVPGLPQGWFLTAAILAGVLVNAGGTLAGLQFLKTRRQRAETAKQQYLANPQSASPMFLVEDVLSPDELAQEELARQELNEAVRQGIYQLAK